MSTGDYKGTTTNLLNFEEEVELYLKKLLRCLTLDFWSDSAEIYFTFADSLVHFAPLKLRIFLSPTMVARKLRLPSAKCPA